MFEDRSAPSGLGPPSLPYTGFGTAWFDFDNDGWLDLLRSTAPSQTIEALAQASDPFPLDQRKQLFRNLGNGRFEDVTDRAGRGRSSCRRSGRGAAFGDIDNDGDIDVLVGNNNGRRACWSTTSAAATTGWGCGSSATGWPARHARRAVAIVRGQRSDALAAGASRRQLRVGQRSARARRPRRSTEPPRVRVHWPDGTSGGWTALPSIDTRRSGGGTMTRSRKMQMRMQASSLPSAWCILRRSSCLSDDIGHRVPARFARTAAASRPQRRRPCARRPARSDERRRPVRVPDPRAIASLHADVGERRRRPAADRAAAYRRDGKAADGGRISSTPRALFRTRRRSRPTDMRWPYYLGHRHRFRNDAGEGRAVVRAARCARSPITCRRSIWLGEMQLAQNRPDAAEPLFGRRGRWQPQSGGGALRPGSRGAREHGTTREAVT